LVFVLVCAVILIRVICLYFFFLLYVHPRALHSFPTRRSSDLMAPDGHAAPGGRGQPQHHAHRGGLPRPVGTEEPRHLPRLAGERSEEHTSELQSRENLVCRLLLEKKKTKG